MTDRPRRERARPRPGWIAVWLLLVAALVALGPPVAAAAGVASASATATAGSTAGAATAAGAGAAMGGGGAGGKPGLPSPASLALKELGRLDTAPVKAFIDRIDRELGPGAPLTWQSLRDFIEGRGLLRHPGRLLPALGGLFVGELRKSMGLLGKLLLLVVLAGVVRQIQGAFEGEVVGRIADAVVFLALGAICLVGFGLAVGMARGAIRDLSSFMLALLPAIVGLLASSGAWTAAGLMHPVMVAAIDGVGLLVREVVFPLALLGAVLDITSALSPSFRLTSLAGLLRQVSTGLLGLLFTVFLGIVAVQGAAGSIADSVALRTAKYATRAFVPIVGGMLADMTDLVLTSSLLLRSGLGLVGLVSVALLVAIPVLKMLALWSIYRLAAALAQPVGGEAVAQVLGGVSSALVVLTTAVTVVGLMCFLSLAVLVGAGGAGLR